MSVVPTLKSKINGKSCSYFNDFPFFAGIFVVFVSLALPFSEYCTVKNLFEPES